MSSGLIKAQKRLAEMREAGIHAVILNPIEKAMADPKSMRKAINAKCYECVGGEINHAPENWRNEIKLCTSTICPLRNLRPFQ